MALYESLTAQSTPDEIAAAYKEYTGLVGGDTQAAQEAAVNYLTNLGISAPTISEAYQTYLSPAPDPAPVADTGGGGALQQVTSAAPTANASAITFSPDIASKTPLEKAAEYNNLIDKGYTDAQIRAAVDSTFGVQPASDWEYLTNLASQQKAGPVQTPSNVETISIPSTTGTAPANVETSTPASTAANAYFAANPDVAKAYEDNSYGMTPDQFANYHYQVYGDKEGRAAPTTLSGGYLTATGTGGIGEDKYYQNIRDYLSGGTSGALPTMSAIRDAMAQYNVSEEDIRAATGKTLEELDPTLTYYTGKQYEGNQVLNLARQLAAATGTGALQGGVYGEQGASIGFNFDQAQKLFGENTSAVGQVFLDAAAQLIDKGVTDLSQLKYGDIAGSANIRPEVDENGVQTGRYIASWGYDYEGNPTSSRILTPEEAAKVVKKEVSSEDGSYVAYEPIQTVVGKGIYDSNGRLVSENNQLWIGATYTGPGGTHYKLTVDPNTGKPAFSTYGTSTSDLGSLSQIVSVLSVIPSPLQPFAMAANAAIAASQHNPLGALASLTGIPGVSEVFNPAVVGALQTANQLNTAVNAVKSGDPLALAASGLSLTGAGNLKIGDTDYTLGDATRAANFIKAVGSNDPTMVTKALSLFAGTGGGTKTTGGITDRTYDDTIVSAGAKAFVDAKNLNASDTDAYAAANAAIDAAMLDLSKSTPVGTTTTTKDLGEFAGLDEAIQKNAMDDAVRADNLDRIKNEPTFNDAFAKARDLLGPNQTFEWNGKQYSTATFAERPDLSGNVVPGATSTTAGGGRGSYAGYSSVEDAASKANLTTSKASELLNYINTQEETQYDALGNPIGGTAIAGAPDLNTTSGKIANGVANAMNTFFGVVANSPAAAVQAGGNLLSNAGGIVDLVAGKSTDAGNKLRELSGQVDTFVQSVSDPKIKTQQAAIGNAVDKAEGIGGKTAALISAAWDNPLGAANWILTEGFEEVPGVGLALKAGSKLATYGITIANDMMESGGSAYNDTYKAAIQQGMSEKDARDAARNSSLAAMAVTGITQGVVEGKVISKIAGKETAGEFTEGALQSGATQLALGQDLSLDKMLTQGVIEAAVGKGAQTTAEATTATNSDSDVFSTVAPGGSADTSKAGAGSSAVATDSVSGANLATDTGSTALSGSDSAVDASTESGAGVETTTSIDANTGAETTTSVDPNTGATTQSTTDANTGVTTSTTTDSNGNVTSTSTTSVNADTGVKTETTTDSNTGSTTQTTIDSNTGVTTNTSVNANTGVNTQTTVDSNTGVTTNVTTDSNTNVTTETKTDSNTNTTTIVQTDVDTNTQTTIVVDTNTGDIIEETETTVPDDWTPPVIETKTTNTATTTPTSTKPSTTPTVKASTPQASAPAMLAGAGFGVAGFDWNIDPRMLSSRETQKAIDPLQRVMEAQAELEKTAMMQQIDPRLFSILQERMTPDQQPGQQFNNDIGALAQLLSGQPAQTAPAANENPYYSYGSEDSIDSILGGKAANYAEGGYVEPLKASGGAMALPLLAKSGGALGQYGGRENFKDGKHVAGEGDGQSDDIPAWLADGEFVMPSDVVSALGNGSTKAGTDKLYEMMHSIRDRARSKGPKDLPPPALKSPLDYLKSHKRSK